ncbi:MAG TPA: hypothetical protein VIH85_05940 [Solirubrobacteraceae bacterium]
MPPRKHQELLTAAVEEDGAGQTALLAGDVASARAAFARAAGLYRQSWELAHATAYGRLVGMLKAAVLAGGGGPEASYAQDALVNASVDSATASYARALAALILGEDDEAAEWARSMIAGGEVFARTGEALAALAVRDRERYTVAIRAIVEDFERRAAHLTGVAIADTAVVLETLAAQRGMTAAIESPVLPVF